MAKIADVGMVRPHMADLLTAQPLMTPLWAAPEVLRRERAGVKVGRERVGRVGWGAVQSSACGGRAAAADARRGRFGRRLLVQLRSGSAEAVPAGPPASPHASHHAATPCCHPLLPTPRCQADIFSYGLLVWELVSGADIADRQPLALTRSLPPQHQVGACTALHRLAGRQPRQRLRQRRRVLDVRRECRDGGGAGWGLK